MFSLLSYANCPNAVSFPKFCELTLRQQELISQYLPNAEMTFDSWSTANTQALSHLNLQMADGSFRGALDFVVQINHVEGDRLKLEMNSALFDEWRASGAKYQIEFGHFGFDHGDHEGDIDIDAYAPWIFGFIPDPFHLTWDNSDPRCWMGEFERKFGAMLSVVLK